MKALNRKLWRDLAQMKSQALAIALVVTCGVATFVMFLSTLAALRATQESFYREYRFAEVFATLKRAPESLRQRLQDIPGVGQVETRVVAQVRLDMPDFPQPVAALMVSVPDSGSHGLNALYLREGRLPLAGRPDEVVASAPFAQAHGLQPGARFYAILNGRRQQLTMVGTALSPEFIQQMRPGSAFPDYKRYGVMWMGRRALGQAYDMHGAFNDLTLSLSQGAGSQIVIDRIDELLKPFGGQGAYTRKDQLSHRFLSQELQQLGVLASLFPVIFMGIATFLLNVVIGRLVTLQREQVATLKAFGYSNIEVLGHYLKMVSVIVLLGAAGGILFGVWLGKALAGIYMAFYHFPYLRFALQPVTLLEAVAASLAAAVSGTVFAVWRVATLRPAEAMRPEPPQRYRETWLEKLGVKRWLSQPARMIVRHIQRQRIKSLLTVFGIALAGGIILTSLFQRDTVSYMVDIQFGRAQRQDLMIVFTDPTAYRARFDLLGLPEIKHVEVFRAVPVRLRHGSRSYRTNIQGMEPRGDLQRLLDTNLHPVDLPAEGLLLTDFLATLLDVRVGDAVVVEVLEGARPVRETVVAGVVKEYLGVSGYLDLAALNRFMQEGPTLSGAYLSVDRDHFDTLYARLKNMPRVATITERIQEIRNFHRVMQETMLFFTYIATVFSIIIAFGVIYNSARIALAERGRELASLRVMGFTRAEIAYILLGELGILTLIAIPFGLWLGRLMCHYIAHTMQNDLFRVPVVLVPQTYAFATVVVLASALLSGLAVRRRLDQLDLIGVLKAAE
ncbi:ABC transporter permease [Janthinobacterium sp. 17J80-10]|uniref:ABC transporter permease n=1 Tax=Janthinobacterium sp. 17J80-10 TaxID=2497863 RepID=UPI0010053A26|nr:ABC transporter permease [Janthinobacterium sp. 17J80-10]QAU34525.1 FtsX-like permease family protein [Janthinobacterium sp. 17J80-10]